MAPGLGSIISCDTSPISNSAIFGPALRLSSQHCAIIRIGTVELNLPGVSTLVLHNVRHVPQLSRPLISVGQLDEASIRARFSSGGWTLHRGNLLLARGLKVHSLYPLYVTLREGDLFLVDIHVLSLWHGRLGHLSKANITHLSRVGYIPKHSFSDHQFCEHWQYGKQVFDVNIRHPIVRSRTVLQNA